MINVENLIAPNIRTMQAYVTGAPVVELAHRLGCAVTDIIKLDANENPYGPPPAALRALAAEPNLNYYPDPDQKALRVAISSYIHVPAEHILCGAGGDEILDLIGRLFLTPDDAIVDFPPTFGMYRNSAYLANAHYISVPRRADFSIDIAAVEKIFTHVHQPHQPKLLYIANPNNPDGSIIGEKDLLRLLALPVMVILDEAYIQFSSQPSRAGWVPKYDNLIVVHTLSKLVALAGMRVGFGVFPLPVIKHLWKLKQPFTPNTAAHVMAIGALGDPEFLREMCQKIVAERNRFSEAISEIDWLEPTPSETSFVLCKINREIAGSGEGKGRGLAVQHALEAKGILLRVFASPALRDYIRISIGTPEQMDKVLVALREL